MTSRNRKSANNADTLQVVVQKNWNHFFDCFYYLYCSHNSAAKSEFLSFVDALHAKIRVLNISEYHDIWLFRFLYEYIRRRYENVFNQFEDEFRFSEFDSLEFEEKMVLLFCDRNELSINQIAAIMQKTPWSIERRLHSGREKLAEKLDVWERGNPFLDSQKNSKETTLHIRVHLNRKLGSLTINDLRLVKVAEEYVNGLRKVQNLVKDFKLVEAPIAPLDLQKKPIFQIMNFVSFSWSHIPWYLKLIIEGFGFAVGGAIAVFVIPLIVAVSDSDKIITNDSVAKKSEPNITSGADPFQQQDLSHVFDAVEYEKFSDVEFPTEGFKKGAAPLAPSRRNTNIYRLIVQSPSPKELIPRMNAAFAKIGAKQLKRSGQVMPGGIYFDVVTNEKGYDELSNHVKEMGKFQLYSNRHRRSPARSYEWARVIIWVQQI